jgi:hypothetical protein
MDLEEEQKRIIQLVENVPGGRIWGKYTGDVCCRIVKKHVENHVPKELRVVGPRSPKVSVGAKERQLKWKPTNKLRKALDLGLLEEWLTDVPVEQQQVLPTLKEWKRWLGSPRTDKSVVIPVVCPCYQQSYEVRIFRYGKIETTI